MKYFAPILLLFIIGFSYVFYNLGSVKQEYKTLPYEFYQECVQDAFEHSQEDYWPVTLEEGVKYCQGNFEAGMAKRK